MSHYFWVLSQGAPNGRGLEQLGRECPTSRWLLYLPVTWADNRGCQSEGFSLKGASPLWRSQDSLTQGKSGAWLLLTQSEKSHGITSSTFCSLKHSQAHPDSRGWVRRSTLLGPKILKNLKVCSEITTLCIQFCAHLFCL